MEWIQSEQRRRISHARLALRNPLRKSLRRDQNWWTDDAVRTPTGNLARRFFAEWKALRLRPVLYRRRGNLCRLSSPRVQLPAVQPGAFACGALWRAHSA